MFIELDYLHETPSALPALSPNNRHSYRIVVLDPRPQIQSGWASINEFGVDEPILTVVIPLSSDDLLTVDFDVPCQKQFAEVMYGLESVDYRQLPVNSECYHPADQARIARRMLAVLNAQQTGKDLKSGPFPVEDISLEAAVARIESLRQPDRDQAMLAASFGRDSQ